MQYITEQALILIPVLNVLGMIIKGIQKSQINTFL